MLTFPLKLFVLYEHLFPPNKSILSKFPSICFRNYSFENTKPKARGALSANIHMNDVSTKANRSVSCEVDKRVSVQYSHSHSSFQSTGALSANIQCMMSPQNQTAVKLTRGYQCNWKQLIQLIKLVQCLIKRPHNSIQLLCRFFIFQTNMWHWYAGRLLF